MKLILEEIYTILRAVKLVEVCFEEELEECCECYE